MTSVALERSAFSPPPAPGLIRSFFLAILAHIALLALLASGVQWHRDSPDVVAEAELWSALPVQAAPPPPEPAPEVPDTPAPPPQATPPAPTQADIALERERQRQQAQAVQEQAARARQAQERAAKEKADKAEKERAAKEKTERDKQEQQKRQKAALNAAKEAARKTPPPANNADARRLEELRQQNLKRMAGLAGTAVGNGDANATGSAAQASGPSAGYAGRIRARIKPNIIFTESIVSNPVADVEVHTSADGTIISRRIAHSSGVPAWDSAVINAIDKTEKLPRDVDGQQVTSFIISFRPKD